MAIIEAKYWTFYLEGREARRLRSPVTVPQLALELVHSGGDLRSFILKACQPAREEAAVGRSRRNWFELADKAAISRGGMDIERAFSAWLDGRIDELAFWLESKVVSSMLDDDEGVLVVEDDDDDEDDDDEDDDDEDDDDEDDDDEDDKPTRRRRA